MLRRRAHTSWPLCTPGLNVAVGGMQDSSSQYLVLFLLGLWAGDLAEVHVSDRGHLCTRNATLRPGVRRGCLSRPVSLCSRGRAGIQRASNLPSTVVTRRPSGHTLSSNRAVYRNIMVMITDLPWGSDRATGKPMLQDASNTEEHVMFLSQRQGGPTDLWQPLGLIPQHVCHCYLFWEGYLANTHERIP